jgi:hypothetical protein
MQRAEGLARGRVAGRLAVGREVADRSALPRFHRTIGWIRRTLRETLSGDSLASQARVIASALYQHFTAMKEDDAASAPEARASA